MLNLYSPLFLFILIWCIVIFDMNRIRYKSAAARNLITLSVLLVPVLGAMLYMVMRGFVRVKEERKFNIRK